MVAMTIIKLGAFFTGLALCLAGTLPASAQDEMKFKVVGENPGGKGGYRGEVTVSKLSDSTANIEWVTGSDKEVTKGISIRTGTGIGAAYGGESLFAMAVYELKGKTISAVWTTAANPAVSGKYELKGTNYKGACTFADGTPGKVTFTPGEGGMYKVVWDLASGHFEGVGVRNGDILVAASGVPSGYFGVAAYLPKGEDIVGVWGTTQTPTAGKEVWTLGGDEAPQKADSPNSAALVFSGDTYELRENKSAPGQPVSELREYLQKGETWEGYRKMVALRMMSLKDADADKVAKNHLEAVKAENPDSFVKEVKMGADSSTFLFILVKGDDVEMNLWNYRKTLSGVAGAQFVFRNKVPFETKEKFKAEQDSHFVTWVEELEELGKKAEAMLKATAGAAVATEAPPTSDAEIAKAISKDMEKCGEIAMKFVNLLAEEKVSDAADLMSDRAFQGEGAKDEFMKKLAKTNAAYGKLIKFTADKEASDFELKDGLLTFSLFGDVEYENVSVREAFVFIRSKEAKIEFVGFSRKIVK